MDEYTLTDIDREELQRAFKKFDKKNSGSIKPTEAADVMRMAGQNPTMAEEEEINQEANTYGGGVMLMWNDMLLVAEKYWRNPQFFESELREACLAFDRKDEGVIEFDNLKNALLKYGDVLTEDDIDLMHKAFNASDGKIIVEEFMKALLPSESENNKPKKGKKSGSAKAGKKK